MPTYLVTITTTETRTHKVEADNEVAAEAIAAERNERDCSLDEGYEFSFDEETVTQLHVE